MATNNFLPFAAAGGANVLTQVEYAAEAARLAGVIAGVGRAKLANKSWRQSAAMAAVMGRFIAEIGLLDALDDGDIDVLLDNFVATYRGQKPNYVVGSGTANAITATLDPAPANLAALTGTPIRVKIGATNTSADVTIDFGTGAIDVIKPGGGKPAIGDLAQGMIATFVPDVTNVQLVSVSAASGAVPGANGFIAYTTPGTYTFTPGAGVYAIRAGGCAGGGGGGGRDAGGGTGGGAGGYGEGWYPVTPGVGVTVIIGGGGAGGSVSANGSAGGTTSIGSFISASGGGGGSFDGVTGGASGSASGGQINSAGGGGGNQFTISGFQIGGQGGGGYFGNGGLPNAGNAATYGAGGAGGGSGGSGQGGNGQNGYAFIQY